MISNVSWQQEIPQCSEQQFWGNSKNTVAHHVNQKCLFFFTVAAAWLFFKVVQEQPSFRFLRLCFDRSSHFSLSICTEEVRDSCLSDWTFQVFHLQFACHVAKLILTHFYVDTFLVNCTYCLSAFQFEEDVETERDSKWDSWLFRQVHWCVDANGKSIARLEMPHLNLTFVLHVP